MDIFKKYENGLVEKEDTLSRSILRGFRVITIKYLIEEIGKHGTNVVGWTSVLDNIIDVYTQRWICEEYPVTEAIVQNIISHNFIDLILRTAEEIKRKKENNQLGLSDSNHVLYYWRDEASSELKEMVYKYFEKLEKLNRNR